MLLNMCMFAYKNQPERRLCLSDQKLITSILVYMCIIVIGVVFYAWIGFQ